MSFLKNIFKMMPNLDPKAISIIEIEVSFEDLWIKTKKDCDNLISMMDKEENHEKTLNSILDYRNTL